MTSPWAPTAATGAIIDGPFGHAALAGNTLFVPDQGNSRILAFDMTSPSNGMTASFVLGAPDLQTLNGGAISASLFGAYSVATDGTHLAVVDGANRVLIWNTIPTASNTPADVVLGQPDFTSNAGPTGCTASSFGGAADVAFINGGLYVVDSSDFRVLIWNSVPTSNNAPATSVLGQADLTTCSGAGPLIALGGLHTIASDGTNLFVQEQGADIAVWNTLAPATGTAPAFRWKVDSGFLSAASGVLYMVSNNQLKAYTTPSTAALPAAPSATVGTPATGTTSSVFQSATYPTLIGTDLWVSDTLNNRMLRFSTSGFSSASTANLVLGAPNFTTPGAFPQPTATGFMPSGLVSAGGQLWVLDGNGDATPNFSRALAFELPAASNGPAAAVVLGAPDFVTNPGSTTTSQTVFLNLTSLASDGTRLLAGDGGANRILIYNAIPTTNGAPADAVWGVSNFTSSGGACSSTTATSITGLATGGGSVALVDGNGNRTLLFGAVPSGPSSAAGTVLGQSGVSTCGASAASQTSEGNAQAVWTDGARLVVADSSNNRVLIWNSFPMSDDQPASVVLGQPNFTAVAPGLTASGMHNPFAVTSNGTQLFVVDNGNARVLVWNTFPTVNGQAADGVLGQPDFSTNTQGNPSASTLFSPTGVAATGGRLYVADQGFNYGRILVW